MFCRDSLFGRGERFSLFLVCFRRERRVGVIFDQERKAKEKKRRRRPERERAHALSARRGRFFFLFSFLNLSTLQHTFFFPFFQPPFVPRLSQHLRHGFLRPGTSLIMTPSRDSCAGRNGRGSAVAAPRCGGVLSFFFFAEGEQRKTKKKKSWLVSLTPPDRSPRGHLRPVATLPLTG